jgi:hypothetical protein
MANGIMKHPIRKNKAHACLSCCLMEILNSIDMPFWLSEVGVSGQPALLQQISPRRHILRPEVNYLTHLMHKSRKYKNRAFRWSKF